MRAPSVLVLRRADVAALLDMRECIAAVEEIFRRDAEGRTLPGGLLSIPAVGGGFHVKAAGLIGKPSRFAAKVNGNFVGNRERFGLPTIQGVIVLCDAERGSPLAVLDSAEITGLRTAAAATSSSAVPVLSKTKVSRSAVRPGFRPETTSASSACTSCRLIAPEASA